MRVKSSQNQSEHVSVAEAAMRRLAESYRQDGDDRRAERVEAIAAAVLAKLRG